MSLTLVYEWENLKSLTAKPSTAYDPESVSATFVPYTLVLLRFILIPSFNLILDLNGSNVQVAQPKF